MHFFLLLEINDSRLTKLFDFMSDQASSCRQLWSEKTKRSQISGNILKRVYINLEGWHSFLGENKGRSFLVHHLNHQGERKEEISIAETSKQKQSRTIFQKGLPKVSTHHHFSLFLLGSKNLPESLRSVNASFSASHTAQQHYTRERGHKVLEKGYPLEGGVVWISF